MVSSSAPELIDYNCFWVIALWQVKCIWYVQYRIMIGVQKGKSSIWQAVSISLWKKKKETCHFVYSERKHGETGSSSQNFTQYRKLLAMRKKSFLFLECGFHGVNWQSEWMCFWHQFMPNIVHFMFFLFIFFPGKTVGSARWVPQSLLQFAFQKATENSVFPYDVQN